MSDQSVALNGKKVLVELTELKCLYRNVRQDLEEKTDEYNHVCTNLEELKAEHEQLKVESKDWYSKSLELRSYRDKVDILMNEAEKAVHLQSEVKRLEHQLRETNFLKERVQELVEDNQLLFETKELIDTQLEKALKKIDKFKALQLEVDLYKSKVNDLTADLEVEREKLEHMIEENASLKLFGSEMKMKSIEEEMEEKQIETMLSDQLKNKAHSRILKLELENRTLTQELENLRDSSMIVNGFNNTDLEKAKSELESKFNDLQDNFNRVTREHEDLEEVFRKSMDENLKLQDTLDQMTKTSAEEQQNVERKINDLEKQLEKCDNDKKRIELISESTNRRANILNSEVQKLKAKVIECDELKMKNAEMDKSDELIEATVLENNELKSEVTKIKCNLSLLGLNENCLDIESVSSTLIRNPIMLNKLCSKMDGNNCDDDFGDKVFELKSVFYKTDKEDNDDNIAVNLRSAKLLVSNNKITFENDVLNEQISNIRDKHDTLIQDQIKMKFEYDQLTSDYRSLKKENDLHRQSLRVERAENRNMKEKVHILERTVEMQHRENETLKPNLAHMSEIRSTNYVLKDDLEKMTSNCDKLKYDYDKLETKYQGLKLHANKSPSIDNEITLKIKVAELTNKCKMLTDIIDALNQDKNRLNDNISDLLSKYHELLTVSFEDKKNFHEDEKQLTEKIFDLKEQKVKLEEKIMDHYKQMESCSIKKRRSSNSFVERMRRAGNGIFNRSPSIRRKSYTEGDETPCTPTNSGPPNEKEKANSQPTKKKESYIYKGRLSLPASRLQFEESDYDEDSETKNGKNVKFYKISAIN